MLAIWTLDCLWGKDTEEARLFLDYIVHLTNLDFKMSI